MKNDISEIIADEAALKQKVSEIAAEINRDYHGKKPVVVGILKGSIIFYADLIRRLEMQCELDFMAVSSYGSSTVSSGELKIKKDLSADITGRDVLVVEDILDTGNTLYLLKEHLLAKGAGSVRLCALFDKPDRRQKPVRADYKGFVIDDLFIVGYGLDYDEKYRNLPYVGVLKKEVYS